MEIEANVDAYLDARDRDARFTSFDYCYNHFQSHRHNPPGLATTEKLERSCLHLGFYLASWGMYRGSSTLLKRSLAYLRPVVEELASLIPGVSCGFRRPWGSSGVVAVPTSPGAGTREGSFARGT